MSRVPLKMRDFVQLKPGDRFVVYWAKDDNPAYVRLDYTVQEVGKNDGSCILTEHGEYDWDFSKVADLDDNMLDTSRGHAYFYESPEEARRTGSMAKTKPTTNQLAPGAAQDAQWLFDQLTGASYYGFAFREVLMKDPEARKAARTLVNQLKAAGVKGMD